MMQKITNFQTMISAKNNPAIPLDINNIAEK